MRRLDARLGVAVAAAAVAVAVVALSGTASSTEPHRAEPGALRLAGIVEQVEPELVVRAEWQWAPAFGEDPDLLVVTLADGARAEPAGTTPIVGDAVEIAGRRTGDHFVADELIVVDLD